MPRQLLDPFFYTADFAPTIAANATVTFAIAIQADADFEWRTLSHSELRDSTVHYTVDIVDSGSGRSLMDRACSNRAIVGIGADPYILASPKRIARNSTLTITLVNLLGTVISELRLTLGGYKIFSIP